jgi:hypothetical protein
VSFLVGVLDLSCRALVWFVFDCGATLSFLGEMG